MSKNNHKELVKKALGIIVQYHDAWRHDFGLPYPFHPMEVTKDGVSRGIEDDELLAAFMCHDLIEDTVYTTDQMIADFGPRVLSVVLEVTKMGIDDKGIEEKMKFLKECTGKSMDSLLLKFSDRFCNVKDYTYGKRDWYPAYYALQAYPLVHHFHNNIHNIKDLFGEKVVMNYTFLIGDLASMVHAQYNLDIKIASQENITIMDDILLNRRKGIYEK